MISYAPLWRTMRERGVTMNALRTNSYLGGGTIQRLKKDMTVSIHTLDILCRVLNCKLQDIAEYIPDK